jgi:hypothetical protein
MIAVKYLKIGIKSFVIYNTFGSGETFVNVNSEEKWSVLLPNMPRYMTFTARKEEPSLKTQSKRSAKEYFIGVSIAIHRKLACRRRVSILFKFLTLSNHPSFTQLLKTFIGGLQCLAVLPQDDFRRPVLVQSVSYVEIFP